jgi:hypothetical protein
MAPDIRFTVFDKDPVETLCDAIIKVEAEDAVRCRDIMGGMLYRPISMLTEAEKAYMINTVTLFNVCVRISLITLTSNRHTHPTGGVRKYCAG